ncbi:hypothetical protein CC1G_02559 [Coprinopsis cinerea okayama7|uniref:F-box domain-containing protein n=1 Tax=Coprinopsis cinerea (strain Okayama-7 / 130 / ATCC MYA-4618 / FGSC 9003) TaxID=240176 RepID=A8NBU9_COPC7|nr:hypothetical protein CC1G_02559 [Coprinopsis cinerea okayama7\|eukprot:XP_001832297.2 hypothetical protein CC1G_02559 [Coprinopsis cinerea okayama7\
MGAFNIFCSVSGIASLSGRTDFVRELADVREKEGAFEKWLERSGLDKDSDDEGTGEGPDSDGEDEVANDDEEDENENDGSQEGNDENEGDEDKKKFEDSTEEASDDGKDSQFENKFPSDEPGEDGKKRLHCQTPEDQRKISEDDPSVVVFNVAQGEDGDGDFYNTKDPDQTYELYIDFGAFPITFTAYSILKTAAPRLTTEALYRLLTRNYSLEKHPYTSCVIPHINYGPAMKSWGQEAMLTDVIGGEDPGMRWMKLLCSEIRSTEDILYEAWRGKGRLWTFVRPNVFPIAETMPRLEFVQVQPTGTPANEKLREAKTKKRSLRSNKKPSKFVSLPLDVMMLMCEQLTVTSFLYVLSLNRAIRTLLLPHVDQIAYRAMQALEPYYFPSKPLASDDTDRQRVELDAWEHEWKEAGFEIEGLRQKAPWLQYRIQCSRSPSMRNRRRIWDIAQQMETLAVKQGILDDSD